VVPGGQGLSVRARDGTRRYRMAQVMKGRAMSQLLPLDVGRLQATGQFQLQVQGTGGFRPSSENGDRERLTSVVLRYKWDLTHPLKPEGGKEDGFPTNFV